VKIAAFTVVGKLAFVEEGYHFFALFAVTFLHHVFNFLGAHKTTAEACGG